MTPQERLRADAARNLDRILAAADEVFAETGVQAGVADVARRAAVGNGTVFRRFACKQDLVAAVAERGLRNQLAAVQHAVQHTPGDARTVLSAALGELVRMRHRCVAEAVFADERSRARVGELYAELAGTVGEVVLRGHRDGSIREDVTVTDLAVLVGALTRASVAPNMLERLLQLLLDGLRPGGTPLPGAPPTWSDAGCTES